MIITKLVLSDFGLYGGHHEFDLRPRTTDEGYRPIILFGGKNGSGKTTILEAVRLCLYGRDALGFRVTNQDYHAHLRSRTHRSRMRTATKALIALEFEYAREQEQGLYTIERSWDCKESEVVEHFAVRKSGELQFGLGPEFWQDLLKDLIPLGLADLFFFDGERIQTLADDDSGGPVLAAALKDLLGVNLIEQLEADLNVYLTKYSKSEEFADIQRRLDELDGQRDILVELQSQHLQDKASSQARHDRALSKIQEKEAGIAAVGGTFADSRSKAETRRYELELIAAQARRNLQEACSNLLPIALAPKLSSELYKQLQTEEQLERDQATRSVLLAHAEVLAQSLSSQSFWGDMGVSLPEEVRTLLTGKVQQTVVAHAGTSNPSVTRQIVHGLSNKDRNRLIQWMDQVRSDIPNEALRQLETLNLAQAELEQVVRLLNAVPPTELLKPLVEELHELHAQAAQLKVDIDEHGKAHDKLRYELDEIDREIQKLQSILHQHAKRQGKGALAAQTQPILEEFRRELLRMKISDLEAAFGDYFNRLARKSEFVSHVIINERDFSMTLVSQDGRFLPKAQLSAGEKQIYAIALLWALRAVAARPLPIIIDTPLGRLDSSHRQNLVDQYFPNASHQVIILSTDTEIDSTHFAQLEPFISHAYQLVYDNATAITHGEEGYFWEATTPKELLYAAQ